VIVPPPPPISSLPVGTQLIAGNGVSTIVADFDFETYSPAGFIWDSVNETWKASKGANEKGLFAVGAAVYTEHPDAEVLSLAYDLKDGKGIRTWRPLIPRTYPVDLFHYLTHGGLLEAFNVSFEKWVWENICVPKYDWPSLIPYYSQLRCAQAKARAFALPGSLDAVGKVLNIVNKKDADGKRLLNKFSIPQKPSKKQPKFRILPQDDPVDFNKLIDYNRRDIEAEAEVSSLIPDLNPTELEFWQCDQAINKRGVQIDTYAIESCISIVEQAHLKYNNELTILTNGEVKSASEVSKLQHWLIQHWLIQHLNSCKISISIENLTKDAIKKILLHPALPETIARVLEIRLMLGSAAVKKPYAMQRQSTREGRLHDLFLYHAARTGRATGTGPQPQNLPNHGPDVFLCECGKYFSQSKSACPWCGGSLMHTAVEWCSEAAEQAIETINSRCLETVEYYWGDALPAVLGCLRGLFIAASGKRLISSDYSAIEAVVLAMLAKEQWRIDIFRTHGKIYEASASKITGIPLSDILNFPKINNNRHHPSRKLGKVAELASGYQGGVGAWVKFKALEQGMTETEIAAAVKKWRAANPTIVNFWYGIERAAKSAIFQPGEHSYNGITYFKIGTVLYCRLLSGRCIVYHNARLEAGRYGDQITYEGWNTNPDNGPIGWIRMSTYGGKLTENIVQAVARDILTHAIVNLEKAGYPVVLHVHDEIVSEIPLNFGSITEFEQIMSTMPPWALDWPVFARGGWEGHRYRK
jgi:DNA polymerase bacteriophage-type